MEMDGDCAQKNDTYVEPLSVPNRDLGTPRQAPPVGDGRPPWRSGEEVFGGQGTGGEVWRRCG